MRPLLLLARALFVVHLVLVAGGAVAQSINAELDALLSALDAGDRRSVLSLAPAIERRLDAGETNEGLARAAAFGFLAEAMETIGETGAALPLMEKAVAAARADGAFETSDGVRARFKLAAMLQDRGRSDDVLAVGAPLLADLKRHFPRERGARIDAMQLMLGAFSDLKAWEQAIPVAREFLDLSLSMFGRDDERVRGAHRILAHALARSGRVGDAIPLSETFLAMTARTFPPDSRAVLEAEIFLAQQYFDDGQIERVAAILTRLEPIMETALPLSDTVRLQAAYLRQQVAARTGSHFDNLAAMDALTRAGLESGEPLLVLGALEEKAARELLDGRPDLQAATLRQLVDHARRHPELSRVRMAQAMTGLAMAESANGNPGAAMAQLDEARRILRGDPGPDSLPYLEAETLALTLRHLAGRSPLTDAELDQFRRLARLQEAAGDFVGAVETGRQLAGHLGDAGRHDAAMAEIAHQVAQWQSNLAETRERARSSDNPHVRDARIPDLTVGLTIELGSLMLKAGRPDDAAALMADRLEQVRGFQGWLGSVDALGGANLASEQVNVYAQYHATALWHAAQGGAREQAAGYAARAFEAVQLAGLGAASAAVARSRIRAETGDPDVLALIRDWDRLSSFGSGLSAREVADEAARQTESADRARRLGALQAQINARFPGYFELIVPTTVSLAEMTGTPAGGAMLREDEAVVLILPFRQLEAEVDLDGLVIAVTRDDIAWAELGVTARSLETEIGALHRYLDPLGTASRAPVSSGIRAQMRGRMQFPFDRAAALYKAMFGAPEIARVLAGKPQWTLVPMGTALATPFAALVVSDPGSGETRDAEAFRAVGWLGLERSLSVYPSVAALKQLRDGAGGPAQPGGLAYLGFGDPAFRGHERARVKSADEVLALRDASRASALRRLPRLPGTRREVEELARHFGAGQASVHLGEQATEAALRKADASGTLGRARIVHFATHGLLSGDFQGLSEPALALSPVADDPGAYDDGLLTASEISALSLGAEWVVLSACNTARDGQFGGDGLGALVQAFLGAGARGVLASHWAVDDSASAFLVSQSVLASERGQSKPDAVRASMAALFHDTGRDGPAFSNAHPSVWAPFFLVGGR